MTVSKCRFKDRRVLIRADLNVPVENGEIMNTEKIELALPTIQYVLDRGAKSVVLMSHMGRPEGRVDPALSLRPVASQLESLLEGRTVTFLEDCVGEMVEEACANPEPGSVILLENLRFHPEEEGRGVDDEGEKVRASPEDVQWFRDSLKKLGDIYVNDAFGTANRAHSSVVGVDLPDRVAGFHLKKEVEKLSRVIEEPNVPYLAIVGGDKLWDKIELIENLMNRITDMIIAGGVAFTFLKVLNDMEIGAFPFDEEMTDLVLQIHQKAMARNVNLHFPVDFVVTDPLDDSAELDVVDVEKGIPENKVGMDIGEKSRERFADVISQAKTIVWNGAPGNWESQNFSEGSNEMAKAVVEATEQGVPVILADREAVNFAKRFDIDLQSVMWGGASLELLEGKVLPGVAALSNLPKLKPELNIRPMRTCALANQRVGIRLDLDVPVVKDEEGNSRVAESGIPKLTTAVTTIKKALAMGARSVVILSHRGNPRGQVDPDLSMEPVAQELENLLERPVTFVTDYIDEASQIQVEDPWPGSVFVLENLRFNPEELIQMVQKSRMESAALSATASQKDRTEEEAELKDEAQPDPEEESKIEVSMNEEMEENAEKDSGVPKPDRSANAMFAQQVAAFR
ncbi:phosphoglycerate kinase [Elysia marginata]|uniref:Phosphoglycerate kinase n=1 Tax=Elysia marginata TaxID=1093978 RepID=A0AAV4FS20_9GAST|nr:phosphoglycerate kinase [Elysia marginata]